MAGSDGVHRTPLEAQQGTTGENGDPLAQILVVQLALRVVAASAQARDAQECQVVVDSQDVHCGAVQESQPTLEAEVEARPRSPSPVRQGGVRGGVRPHPQPLWKAWAEQWFPGRPAQEHKQVHRKLQTETPSRVGCLRKTTHSRCF